jgi:hypothetical protein
MPPKRATEKILRLREAMATEDRDDIIKWLAGDEDHLTELLSGSELADEQPIREFLLGDFQGQDGKRFELRLSSDERLLAHTHLVENYLIDDYLAGELSPDEVKKFERYFLADPKRQAKLTYTRLLQASSEGALPDRSGEESAAAQASGFEAKSVSAKDKLAQWWRSVRDALPLPNLAVLTLVPGQVRGGTGGIEDVKVEAGTQPLQIKILLPEESHASYRVELHVVEGQEVWAEEGLFAQVSDAGLAVIVTLPPGLVGEGEYKVILSGVSESGDYEKLGTYYRRVGS